jgi:EmrB/QacA subfamily drug resistance transporter
MPDNDDGTLASLQQRYGERYRWLLLLSVMVGTMASVMSSTILNVAVPDLSRYFNLGQASAQWVTSGFMVSMTASMLTTPWLLSRYGYRRVYAGTMLLLMGGIIGGLATHYPLVLAARVAEGLAAGVVQPIPAIIILRAFAPTEQGRASGIFGMGVVLAPAIGPSLGGVLVDLWGWRSIFFMVVPFCLGSLWLAFRYVPVTGPGGVLADRGGAALDWPGLALATTGSISLLNGLVALRTGSAMHVMALLGLGSVCLSAFIAWQHHLLRQDRAPLLNLHVFGFRGFAMGSVVAAIYGTALFGSTYLIPVYLQEGLAWSASLVGSVLLPAGIVLAATIAIVGRLTDRYPTHWLVSLGIGLLAASFGLMVCVRLDSPVWLVAVLAVVGRIGLGFILPSLNIGSMRGLPAALIPQASSAINFLRMLGGSAGVSLCGVALEWRFAAHAGPAGLTASARLAAFDEVFLMLAVVCALALLAAWHVRAQDTNSPPAQGHGKASG